VHGRAGRIVALLVALAISGCRSPAPDPVARLTQLAPGLDHEFAAHLVADDDSAFASYGARRGWSTVYHVVWLFSEARHTNSLADLERVQRVLAPYGIKLARMIDSAYGLRALAREIETAYTAPSSIEFARIQRAYRIWRLRTDRSQSPQAVEQELNAILAGCAPGEDGLRSRALSALADLKMRTGETFQHLRFRRAAVLEGARIGDTSWLQDLGMLGDLQEQRGETDSARVLWQQGLEYSRRHRMDYQAARFSIFLGNHFASAGRWGIASDYVDDAREIARSLDDPGQRQWLLLETLEFSYRMGSTVAMRRQLRVADTELNRARERRFSLAPGLEARISELHALTSATSGDPGDAELWFKHAERYYLASGARDPRYPGMLVRRARILRDTDRPKEALRIARRALEYADRESISECVAEATLAIADASIALGRGRDAAEALARFDRSAVPPGDPKWLEYDVLRVRLLAPAGDRPAMTTVLRTGLARIETTMVRAQSDEARLELARHGELHEIVHERLDRDPRLGYEFEMAWRRASTTRALPARSLLTPWASIAVDPKVALQALPGSASPDDSTLQVVYFWGDRVVRWTRSRRGITRAEITTRPDELEQRMESVRASLAVSHHLSRSQRARVSAELHELAVKVLPREMLESPASARFRTLEILPDGALGRLPFGALNVMSEGYRPLLASVDVVYARGEPAHPARKVKDAGLVIVDPELSPALRRRHGGLPRLPSTHAEADLLRTFDPRVSVLVGNTATRSALLAGWERHSWLYFAGHVLTSSDSPWLSFIPLAADPTLPGIEKEYCESADIMGADLSGCELVVLSGCATGVTDEPGVGGMGLAHSFLDAGARAVVWTFWSVNDAQVPAITESFIRGWQGEREAPDRALCRAQREYAGRDSALVTASTWAAWAIERARLSSEGAAQPVNGVMRPVAVRRP